MRLSTLRKLAMWTCIGICFVTLVLWILTIPILTSQNRIAWSRDRSGDFGVYCGVFSFKRLIDTNALAQTLIPHDCQFHLEKVPNAMTGLSKYGIEFPDFSVVRRTVIEVQGNLGSQFIVKGSIPLLFLLPMFMLPTAILWYLDHRTQRGHCRKCDYNLTGNLSGICPECGTKTTSDSPHHSIPST
jgi:hypothetical protein